MKLVSISYVFVLSQSGPKKMINLYELTNFLVISTTVMWDEEKKTLRTRKIQEADRKYYQIKSFYCEKHKTMCT